jgi:hypothetical protein
MRWIPSCNFRVIYYNLNNCVNLYAFEGVVYWWLIRWNE